MKGLFRSIYQRIFLRHAHRWETTATRIRSFEGRPLLDQGCQTPGCQAKRVVSYNGKPVSGRTLKAIERIGRLETELAAKLKRLESEAKRQREEIAAERRRRAGL